MVSSLPCGIWWWWYFLFDGWCVCCLYCSFSYCNIYLGIYVGVGPTPEDEAAFLTERHCLTDLLEGMKSPCPCGISHNAWTLSSVVQVRPGVVMKTPVSVCTYYRRAMCWGSCFPVGAATGKRGPGQVPECLVPITCSIRSTAHYQ